MAKQNQPPIDVGCPNCQRRFTSKQALGGHTRFCSARNAGAAAAPFVAQVGQQAVSEPAIAPGAAAGPEPAALAVVPAYVAAVEAPPPPPPPAAAEVTQYVPRMPLPNPAAGPGGTRAEHWRPEDTFPNQLQPLHGVAAPVAAAVAMVAPNSPPATLTVTEVSPAGPVNSGTALAVVDDGPKVDIVKAMQVFSKRIFTWEGSGALTNEECDLLRTVITWQPGPASSAAVILSGVFLPRILTHPVIASRLVAKLDKWIGELDDEGEAESPAAAAAPSPAAEPAPRPAPRPVAVVPDHDEEVRRSWAERGVDLQAETSQAGRGAA